MPVNLPNLITVSRMLLVPVTVWCIINGSFSWAFACFILAGIGDGVDGWLARRFGLQTELGGYLDPLADKALLVSIYVVLGVIGVLPTWLAILVVTRDALIVGAVILAWLLERPVAMKPLWVSKINTVLQILYAGLVLGALGFGIDATGLVLPGAAAVSFFTLLSGAFYLRNWLGHMSQEPEEPKQ